MNETKIDYLALDRIKPSATNPRKHFDEKYIAELSESIRAKGVLQPLTVRPDWCMGKTEEQIAQVNGNAPPPVFFEIVAGECRYRGAVKVPLPEVPTIIRFLSDKETFENQLIENLQRSDLTPFEEAEGYRRLIKEMGHNVESIHAKTGKSSSRIYDRLKLLNAPARMRQAVREGLSVVIAEKVGAMPTQKMREAASAEILKPTDPRYGVGPMTVRQALDFIETNFMRQLSSAVFDREDATLVPTLDDDGTGERLGGGACGDCPRRTGNMPGLTGVKRPDVCTNPHCYAMKTDAHFVRLKASAGKDGRKLLTVEEAADLFESDGTLRFDSPYELMSERPDKMEERSDFTGKLPTWRQLLEPLASKPEIVLAPHPKGQLAELVDRSLAIAAVSLAAEEKGEKSIFDKTSQRSTSAASSAGMGGNDDAARRQREKAKLSFQVTLASMGALIAAIDDAGPVPGFWDELIRASITHAGHDGCWLICKLHGLDPKAKNKTNNLEGVAGAALEYGLTLQESDKLGYLVELLLSQRVKFSNAYTEGLKAVESFQAFVKLYKVDLAAVEKRVRTEAKEGKRTKENAQRPTSNAQRPTKKEPKQATPKATNVNPTQQQMENAFSGGEIVRGTIRQPVMIEGREYAVTCIAWDSNKGPEPTFDLVELIPAADFKGEPRDPSSESPKKGPKGYYHGVKINYHGKAFVLGFSRKFSFAKKKPAKSKRTVARVAKPKKSRSGLTAAGRAKLNAAMKARWAARRKHASKKGGAKK